jgi:hypothetical protein
MRPIPPLPFTLLVGALLLGGCVQPRTFAPRQGDEIIVAGQLFHTGTKIVTWMDSGGYDAPTGRNAASHPTSRAAGR